MFYWYEKTFTKWPYIQNTVILSCRIASNKYFLLFGCYLNLNNSGVIFLAIHFLPFAICMQGNILIEINKNHSHRLALPSDQMFGIVLDIWIVQQNTFSNLTMPPWKPKTGLPLPGTSLGPKISPNQLPTRTCPY